MRRILFALSLSLAVCAGAEVPQDAKLLYEGGMYRTARELFAASDDPVSLGYSVLCAVKYRASDAVELMESFGRRYPESVFAPQIKYQYALNLFEDGRYEEAGNLLEGLNVGSLGKSYATEYAFKLAYCRYVSGNVDGAFEGFSRVSADSVSKYAAPACYYCGYIDYSKRDFDGALKWLERSARDERFRELSDLYILECRFMKKEYGFVAAEGERIYDSLPEARRKRVARLVSESYLVLGDTRKARRFLDDEAESSTRSDYFHAASVLYAAGDYAGALEKFAGMENRTDSLGQIANYQMAYAYIRTGNKVAALDSFNDAAKYNFNPSLREDAAFNYAKLAYDLNHDTAGFKAYMSVFPNSGKDETIYGYMAVAELANRDYAAAIDSYDKMENLNPEQKGNYMKANYLRAGELVSAGAWSDAVPLLRTAGFYYPRSDSFNQLSRYYLAEAYYKTARFGEAQRLFTDLYNASALYGTLQGVMLSYNVAYCCFLQQNWQVAARWFDTFADDVKRGREGASGVGDDILRDASLRRADCDFMRRDYKAAIASYARCRQMNPSPDDVYPYFRQGIASGLSGDVRGKIKYLEEVRKADPSVPYYADALYELGRAYIEAGDDNAAVQAFSDLKSSAPDNTYVARALIGTGMVRRNEKRYDEALDCYKEVVRMYPGTEFAQNSLLAIESIYQSQGRPDRYLAYLETEKLVDGRTPEEMEKAVFNSAEQTFLAANYPEAEKLLQRYLDSYPGASKRGEAWFYLAESSKYSGDKEKALECYLKAVEALPDGAFIEMSRLNCGDIAYSLEKYSDAQKAYDALLRTARLEENKALALAGKMRSAFKARDYAVSAEVAGSLTGDAQTLESRFILGKSLMSLGRRDEALEVFRALSLSDPSTPEGAEAACVIVQDRFDRAEYGAVDSLVYEFSGKLGEQSRCLARLYVILGDSFLQRGNTAQAKATYESIRDGYTPSGADDDILETVRKKLENL